MTDNINKKDNQNSSEIDMEAMAECLEMDTEESTKDKEDQLNETGIYSKLEEDNGQDVLDDMVNSTEQSNKEGWFHSDEDE